jgi:hypothetical protein
MVREGRGRPSTVTPASALAPAVGGDCEDEGDDPEVEESGSALRSSIPTMTAEARLPLGDVMSISATMGSGDGEATGGNASGSTCECEGGVGGAEGKYTEAITAVMRDAAKHTIM